MLTPLRSRNGDDMMVLFVNIYMCQYDQWRSSALSNNAICNECVELAQGDYPWKSYWEVLADLSEVPAPPGAAEYLEPLCYRAETELSDALAVAVYNHTTSVLTTILAVKKKMWNCKVKYFDDWPDRVRWIASWRRLWRPQCAFAIADTQPAFWLKLVMSVKMWKISSSTLQAADFNIERAERGVLYVDELTRLLKKGKSLSPVMFRVKEFNKLSWGLSKEP